MGISRSVGAKCPTISGQLQLIAPILAGAPRPACDWTEWQRRGAPHVHVFADSAQYGLHGSVGLQSPRARKRLPRLRQAASRRRQAKPSQATMNLQNGFVVGGAAGPSRRGARDGNDREPEDPRDPTWSPSADESPTTPVRPTHSLTRPLTHVEPSMFCRAKEGVVRVRVV